MTFQEIRRRADRLRDIPLEAILSLSGARPDRADKAKWHTPSGTLSVSGAKFMNWRQGTGGGGAIDLVIHLNRCDFKTAVRWLDCHFPVPGDRQPPASHAPRQMRSSRLASPSRLVLPPRDASQWARVKHYLVHHRRIPTDLIETLLESGTLYADNTGNAVFLLLNQRNAPVGAELRGASPQPWRGMAPGSRKDLGYFHVSSADPEAIVLCESAIDAISCLALKARRLCISTAGARANPAWLPSLLTRNLPVYCAFDADPTGDTTADAMIALYPAVQRLRPALHDWNDLLHTHP